MVLEYNLLVSFVRFLGPKVVKQADTPLFQVVR